MTLDDRLQELSNYAYNAGASAKHNGIFVGGEPKKEGKQAILSDLKSLAYNDGNIQVKDVEKYCGVQ